MKNKSHKMVVSNLIRYMATFLLHIFGRLARLGLITSKATFYHLSLPAFLVAFFIISLIYEHGHMATYLVSGTNEAALDVYRNDYSNLNTYNV